MTFRSRAVVALLSAQALFFLIGLGVATVKVAAREPAEPGLLALCLALTFAAGWFLFGSLRMKLVIDEEGFVVRNLFERTKRVSWDQVRAVGWADLGTVLISNYPTWRPTVAFRVAGRRGLVGADATCLMRRSERERLAEGIRTLAIGRGPLIVLKPDDLRGYWFRPGDRTESLRPD